jgi:hypothetical protein
MSDNIQTNGAANAFFQKQFGSAPGGEDAKAECEKWQRLCDGLLAERSRLQEELENLRLEQITKEWEQMPIPPWEEMEKQIDRSTTLEEIIAKMKAELGAKNGQP